MQQVPRSMEMCCWELNAALLAFCYFEGAGTQALQVSACS